MASERNHCQVTLYFCSSSGSAGILCCDRVAAKPRRVAGGIWSECWCFRGFCAVARFRSTLNDTVNKTIKDSRIHSQWQSADTTTNGHYTGQPALAGMSSWELEDSVSAKFYCCMPLLILYTITKSNNAAASGKYTENLMTSYTLLGTASVPVMWPYVSLCENVTPSTKLQIQNWQLTHVGPS